MLGPFSSVRRVGSIINQAIPFVFTGLCFCFMYAVNKFNLAGEGIFMFAGCMSTLVAVNLGEGLPFPLMVLILMVVGAITGIVMIAIPALLDAKFQGQHRGGIPDAQQHSGLSLHLGSEISDEGSVHRSYGILSAPDNAVLPNIFGKFRIQSGLFFAIIAVILVAILFYKMVFGYKMRVVEAIPCSQRPAAST